MHRCGDSYIAIEFDHHNAAQIDLTVAFVDGSYGDVEGNLSRTEKASTAFTDEIDALHCCPTKAPSDTIHFLEDQAFDSSPRTAYE